VKAAETAAYRSVDAVVSMLPKVHEYMQSRGLPLHKLHIVQNGIDPAEWLAEGPALDAQTRARLAQIRASGYSIVGYAGTHGVANAMDVFIEAANMMKGEKIAFVLVGGGPNKDQLRQRAAVLDLQNVFFFEPVKKAQIPALLEWFDIAYIGWHRQPLYRFGISPNKLMDYMMAGRPILHAVEAGNDPVADAACGLTVAPEDPTTVVRGIRSLLAESSDTRHQMGQRGRQFVLDNHTYAVLAERFVAAFR
jgi:glycosyltransferase involved in cell wall biosynthesis